MREKYAVTDKYRKVMSNEKQDEENIDNNFTKRGQKVQALNLFIKKIG